MNKKEAIKELKSLVADYKTRVQEGESRLLTSKVLRDEGVLAKKVEYERRGLAFYTYLLEELEKQAAKPVRTPPPVVNLDTAD